MDGGGGGAASAGLGERVWTQLVARNHGPEGLPSTLQDSQETPGWTDGLEFVRLNPSDWPAVCPDRHREAIHHLILLSLSLSLFSLLLTTLLLSQKIS